MSNRHLPAGQRGGVDMNSPRRRHHMMNGPQPHQQYGYQQQQQQQYGAPQWHQQQQQYPQQMGMGNPYATPYMQYPNQQYYGMPYQNGMGRAPGYYGAPAYPAPPGVMPHYQPNPLMGISVGVNGASPYPQQHSPAALATSYQPPPAPVSLPPQTPTSTHSSQMIPPASPAVSHQADAHVEPHAEHQHAYPSEPQVDPRAVSPAAQRPESVASSSAPATVSTVQPPITLPWTSCPESEFPKKTQRSKPRRKMQIAGSQRISLPPQSGGSVDPQADKATAIPSAPASKVSTQTDAPSTPSSTTLLADSLPASSTRSPVASQSVQAALPLREKVATQQPETGETQNVTETADAGDDGASETKAAEEPAPAPRQPPSSWANLFARKAAAVAAAPAATNGTPAAPSNGTEAASATDANPSTFPKPKANSMVDAMHSYAVGRSDNVTFIEPRGLINTGNMCYMNSVLQVLMFCTPFFNFLKDIGLQAAHSFKSETPLLDAMILFLQEYRVLKESASVEQLAKSLKPEDLEKYGQPFTPEFVYEAIRRLTRFDSMRRGHQQDAEEFLGFLLSSLDEECDQVLKNAPSNGANTPDVGSENGSTAADDWLEVGRKQKAAVSRSTGNKSSTPISKIFGGTLRSEFRVPGLKDSITSEPFQPLQLDIGAPEVRNVMDALRGLTRPEKLEGDFNSPRGKDVAATKQVLIENLPPVLILHLKRFQFDAEGNGTVKIWKKVGYPLELEIPREVLSRQKRTEAETPKYELISVVYHHGKNATAGHYTADVRRQGGKEWIRLDDTVIRRIPREDVAETGSEEERKPSNKEGGASNGSANPNRFDAINDDDTGDEAGWNTVTAPTGEKKRWSNVANGATNGVKKSSQSKESIKDNKVAYLLFYQRV